jgi:hypothetical protein
MITIINQSSDKNNNKKDVCVHFTQFQVEQQELLCISLLRIGVF